MSVNVPIWKGTGQLYSEVPTGSYATAGLTHQKNSGTIVYSDRVTITDIYHGSNLACSAAAVRRGRYGGGTRSGFVCTGSAVEPQGGGVCRLTITWERGGPSAPTDDLPPDEFSLEVVELNPRVERHKNFVAITQENLDLVQVATRGATQALKTSASTKINAASDDNSVKAQKLLLLIQKGVETYYLAGYRYSWSTYCYDLPALVVGGVIQSPGGPLQSYLPSAFTFLRLADSVAPSSVKGSAFKLTRSWLGGPDGHWDTTLYSAS